MIILSFQYLVSSVILISGILSFIRVRKHLLSSLLSLEFIILSIFLLIGLSITFVGGDNYFVLFFLTSAACEGALGLALLVSIVRSHGNDNFNRFNVLEC